MCSALKFWFHLGTRRQGESGRRIIETKWWGSVPCCLWPSLERQGAMDPLHQFGRFVPWIFPGVLRDGRYPWCLLFHCDTGEGRWQQGTPGEMGLRCLHVSPLQTYGAQELWCFLKGPRGKDAVQWQRTWGQCTKDKEMMLRVPRPAGRASWPQCFAFPQPSQSLGGTPGRESSKFWNDSENSDLPCQVTSAISKYGAQDKK